MDNTQFLLFLVTAHMMFFMAGNAGLITDQSNSEHKDFVNQFTNKGKATESLEKADQQGIVSKIGVSLQALPIIGTLVGIFTAPYSLLAGSALPSNLVLLFQALMGVFELAVGVSLYRGVNF